MRWLDDIDENGAQAPTPDTKLLTKEMWIYPRETEITIQRHCKEKFKKLDKETKNWQLLVSTTLRLEAFG